MGPFEYKGELLTTNVDNTVHGPGHHSVLVDGDNYYIVYHRHDIPKAIHGFNRQICIDELHFNDDGTIDIEDVNMLRRLIVRQRDETAVPWAADVNGDGIVNAVDFVLLTGEL